MARGNLFIVSAPSGAGKTSLLKEVRRRLPDLGVSISHTTRAPRPGEVDGRDYFFVDTDTFDEMIAQEKFLEYARVFDYSYGTARESVERALTQGQDLILEIDWQGARQVRQRLPEAISVFILPPSREALESRLRDRGQDSEQVIARRMRDADNEMSHYHEFEHVILNDDFEAAAQELTRLFRAPKEYKGYSTEQLDDIARQLIPTA